jgi:hypothetical protein
MVSAKIGHQPSLAELVRLEDPEFYLDPHPVYDRMRREQRRPEPIRHVLRNGWRSAPIVFGTSSLVPRQDPE